MFLGYVFKLKPNNNQALLMESWLDMLRATYNFSLRDRIEAYEEVKIPRLGNYNITNKRQDYHWKLAHQIARYGDLIVFENLNIKGMIRRCQHKQDEKAERPLRGSLGVRTHQAGKYLKNGQTAKSKLNRLISDASWGEFQEKVKSLTEKLGLHYLEINPKNTSRQCNCCGHTSQDNREQEKFLCTECGNFDDADINAAKNILEKGLKVLNISHIQLPLVRGKVTGMDSILETSSPLGDEPANPTEKLFKQLSLFDLSEWSAG